MEEIIKLEKQINEIKERNFKVEINKAWETSVFRKVSIAILTYFVVVLFFYFANLSKPFINAIVPTTGFLLSTLSLSFLKNVWVSKIYKK